MDFSADLLPFFLIALLAGAILGFLLLRRRQRVRLSDSGPVRPYMSSSADSPREGNDLASQACAGAADVTGEILGAPVHAHLGAGPPPEDFQRMKGVGPKLAQALHARGFHRFEQLAHLTEPEVEMIDSQLGAFAGRLKRDRIVEQAQYLARADQDGFEQRFGKL